jgi:hypothetical protein
VNLRESISNRIDTGRTEVGPYSLSVNADLICRPANGSCGIRTCGEWGEAARALWVCSGERLAMVDAYAAVCSEIATTVIAA